MKKIVVLSVVFVLLASLFLAAAADDIPEKPATPINIRVSVAQTGNGFEILTKAAEDFNASQSDYVVDLYYGGSYSDILIALQTGTMADRPDIFHSSGNDSATYINMEDKMYIPVNDFIQAEGYDDSNIVANLRANYQRNGEWQCWPLGNTNVGIYYNTGALKSVGIDYKDLKSYQEILDACKALKDAGFENFYYLRALTHIDWLNYALTAQGVEYYDMENGRAGVPTKGLYDDGGECQEATTAYFQFLREVVDNYLYDPTVNSDDARIAFAKGEMVFMDGYSSGAGSVINLVADNGGELDWHYGVSPVVEVNHTSKGQSPGGGALFIADTGDYWREQGAWAFMKYLLSDEVTSAYAMATGYTPITESGSMTPEYQDYAQNTFVDVMDVIEAQKNTEEGIAYAPIPFSAEANTLYKEIAAKILEDASYTAEQACADFAAGINEIVELYRLTNGLD